VALSSNSSDNISGKIALVTGASRGIGAGIALALAQAGSDVVVNYCRSERAADEVVDRVRTIGRKALKIKFDVSDFEGTHQAIDQIAALFGRIDILVNNAGVNRDRTFLKMSKEEWDQVMSVNLDGVFNVTKATLPLMIKNGWGRIINVSSIIGITGNLGQTNYSASKAALIGFSKSLAMELAKSNITVNVVAPGFTATEMVEALPIQVKESLVQKILMRRFAQPEEIGQMVSYLASTKSNYVTGEVFTISGGYQSVV
jgi:3-oxoacyl-(acyl-carrier-protein) reductase